MIESAPLSLLVSSPLTGSSSTGLKLMTEEDLYHGVLTGAPAGSSFPSLPQAALSCGKVILFQLRKCHLAKHHLLSFVTKKTRKCHKEMFCFKAYVPKVQLFEGLLPLPEML